ncbi:MAG TPA: gluconate 2-dehydrogenase subunit 3 family protein [Candidatus Methylomirabilis sp.]|nr:gluconate 2-dehydrogenase subunit 3 family protein [Candidatus Methylomirabilis sp.]
MQRRDALKLLISGAVLPTLTPEAFALFRAAHPGEGYALRTLNPHQNATVVTITDLIIPATDTPGAKGAKVNEFIDLILTEWATEEERTNFLDGLAGVDKQSNELFGKDFVEASAEQQTTLLRAMDDAAMPGERTRPRRNPIDRAQRDRQLKGNFWTVFKGITLHGYYTSEIGFSQELKLQIIPGALHGCAPVGERA